MDKGIYQVWLSVKKNPGQRFRFKQPDISRLRNVKFCTDDITLVTNPVN